MKETIIISACLLGIPCRYDARIAGNHFSGETIETIRQKFYLIPVCPEQLGGLPTPRKRVEIQGGDGFSVLRNKSL